MQALLMSKEQRFLYFWCTLTLFVDVNLKLLLDSMSVLGISGQIPAFTYFRNIVMIFRFLVRIFARGTRKGFENLVLLKLQQFVQYRLNLRAVHLAPPLQSAQMDWRNGRRVQSSSAFYMQHFSSVCIVRCRYAYF